MASYLRENIVDGFHKLAEKVQAEPKAVTIVFMAGRIVRKPAAYGLQPKVVFGSFGPYDRQLGLIGHEGLFTVAREPDFDFALATVAAHSRNPTLAVGV